MKRVDQSETGFSDLTWSPDGTQVAYVRGEDEICRSAVDTDAVPMMVARGVCPAFNVDGGILFEKGDEILLNRNGTTAVFIGRSDVIEGTAKRRPCTSMDGKSLLFVIDNVFHKDSQSKNAWPWRTFLGMARATSAPRPKILPRQQWYGGDFTFLPDGGFLHYEYDSTAGARIHMVDVNGETVFTTFGLYPAVSPDGRRLACKPKGGQALVIHTRRGDTWNGEELDTVVCKLPEGGRLSGSPPIWTDNRFVLMDENNQLFRVDTRNQSVEEMKKIPAPALRGSHTMAISPDRGRLALEVPVDGGFEIRVVDLA